jgi:RimJ/RimL family protein N-acetyltransferase
MKPLPSLSTPRLRLRAFCDSDAGEIRRLASAAEIAKGTFVPHPYEDGMAEAWLDEQRRDWQEGRGVNFAIALAEDGRLMGSIGLKIEPEHGRAELGYWIGVPFWGRGYCTEAARVVIEHGFEQCGLHRIFALPFPWNRASARVLEKVGMRYEGRLREHCTHSGERRDAEVWAILRSDLERGGMRE